MASYYVVRRVVCALTPRADPINYINSAANELILSRGYILVACVLRQGVRVLASSLLVIAYVRVVHDNLCDSW